MQARKPGARRVEHRSTHEACTVFAGPVRQNPYEIQCGPAVAEIEAAVGHGDIAQSLQHQRGANPLERGHGAIHIDRVLPGALEVRFY